MEAPENSQPSPSSDEEESLLALRFPKKLWKIVNECKTGAIAWTADGTAVVVDYAKFQSHYLDDGLDVFKTKNISSFIRQLNLYGFRKISPRHRTTVGSAGRPDLHVFWNKSFARDRPDMLPSVSRKKCASRAKAKQKNDGGGPGPSSGRRGLFHGPVPGSPVLHIQDNAMWMQPKQVEVTRAVDVQRSAAQVVRLERQSSRRLGVAQSAVGAPSQTTPCEYNGAYWSTQLWNSEDPTTTAETRDEDDGCSKFSVAKGQKASASAGSSASTAGGGGVVDYEDSDIFVDDLIQRTMPSSPPHNVDMATLLDPNQPPSVILAMHGSDDEPSLTSPIEVFLIVDPSICPVGESEANDFSLISL